ncbi:MAG: hypothetical protein LBV12_10190, partial [Puniceicoccales bacterium]|nr:hypothetical protein [Puniceicoccales bacterium]
MDLSRISKVAEFRILPCVICGAVPLVSLTGCITWGVVGKDHDRNRDVGYGQYGGANFSASSVG